DQLPVPAREQDPKCMELYDQAQGCILYRTRLPAGGSAIQRITELHDYGLIFLNGQKLATLDRRRNQSSCEIPARSAESTLDLLIDTFGHVNYGGYIHDRKGITQMVELVSGGITNQLKGWDVFSLPLDARQLASLRFQTGATELPAFYRGSFELARAGDTFLDLS